MRAWKHGNIRWNAGNGRSNWSELYIGWMSRLDSCRISCATRTLPCGGGDSVMDPGLLLAALDPIGPSSRWPSAHI